MAVELRGMVPLLLVRDLPAAVAFYRQVLGFSVVSTSDASYAPGWALLQRGSTELMLNGMYDPTSGAVAEDAGRARGHGDTALYFGCSDLEEAYEHFRAHGVELQPPAMTGYGFRSISLTDLDGYTLVLHWPATAETKDDWRRRYGIEA